MYLFSIDEFGLCQNIFEIQILGIQGNNRNDMRNCFPNLNNLYLSSYRDEKKRTDIQISVKF